MNNFATEIKGKHVLVFGLGRQGGGTGDVAWLTKHGADVRIADKDLTLAPQGERQEDVAWADYIIKNPGVPDQHPLLVYAKTRHIPVLTAIAVFVKYAGITVVGITGTRGKSTTTALITALLEHVYPDLVITGGNIPGTSGLGLLDQVEGKKYAVLELSSFQLHNFHDLRVSPAIAVITNLYPDHLNRYPDMQSYRQDKEALVAYQQSTDITLANQDNAGAVAISKKSTGQVKYFTASEVADWETSLPGAHNRENIAAMWAVGKTLGLEEELCKQVVRDFHGLPFRQEKIRELNGTTFVNDTTATTPTATLKAIAAQTQPTVLICGGASKNLPEELLVAAIAQNPLIENVVFLGALQIKSFTDALQESSPEKIVGFATSMDEAVQLAVSVAKPGSTVLLSPGFASFDLFQNEFDRGRQFNDVVGRL